MAGYYEQRAAPLGDSWNEVMRTVADRSSPQFWGSILRPPLDQAAGAGNEDLVRRLLLAGANAGGISVPPQRTLVNAAVDGGSARVLSVLLRHGANVDINTCALEGWTPLHRAILEGKRNIAQVLILAGALVNTISNDDDPLHCSIRQGAVRTSSALLLAGAYTHTFLAGTYPINLAAGLGQDEVVHDIIQRGSYVNCRDADGDTPLLRAVSGGHVSTMRVLLSAGANISVLGQHGLDALHLAARSNEAGAVKALVEAGAEVDTRCAGGRTALFRAASAGALDSMRSLLALGADVNAVDDTGMAALHRTAYHGRLEATDLLLRAGADETLVDNQGYLPAGWIHEDDDEESLTRMLARAPQDRAWRRRGFLVVCRARHASKLYPAPCQARPCRARTQRTEAEVIDLTGTAPMTAGAGSSSSCNASGQGRGAGGLVWLLEPANDDVFRFVVGFL